MALKGRGAVIIWNDITAEGRNDFYDWHVNEHIPERVGIDGFIRGRRYLAVDANTAPAYLTLYETDDPAVLSSRAYLARLNDPTPWTKRATAQFQSTSRCLTHIVSAKGRGASRYMATLRLLHSEDGLSLRQRLADCAATLGDRLVHGLVTGLAVCLSDVEISAVKTAESKERTDILQPPIGALLLEGITSDAVFAAMAQVGDVLGPLGDAVWGVYELEFSLD